MARGGERAHRLEAVGVGGEHVADRRSLVRAERERRGRDRRAQVRDAGQERVVEVEHVAAVPSATIGSPAAEAARAAGSENPREAQASQSVKAAL